MKNFSTWLLVLFMIMFWILRVVVALGAELKWDLNGLEPLNMQMEIGLLFLTLVCIILVIKRKLVGGLIYLLSYGMYYGVFVFNNLENLQNAVEGGVDINLYMQLFLSLVGIIIPVAVMLDLLADKNRKVHPKDKKQIGFMIMNNLIERWMREQTKIIIEHCNNLYI